MNWIVRWYVWWPLATLAIVGLAALFFLPPEAKQITVTVVFMILLLLIAWTSKINMNAAEDRARIAEIAAARGRRETDVYGDHLEMTLVQIQKTDPATATAVRRSIDSDLTGLDAIGIPLHRKGRLDG